MTTPSWMPPLPIDVLGLPHNIKQQIRDYAAAVRAATVEECAKAVELAGGDNAEFHAAAIRALKESK